MTVPTTGPMGTLVPALSAAFAVATIAFIVQPLARQRIAARLPTITTDRSSPRRRTGLLTAAGAVLRRVLHRPADHEASARWGRIVGVGVGAALVDFGLGAVGVMSMIIAPILRMRRERLRLESAVVRELPEIIDLVRLSLSAGGSVLLAVRAVSHWPMGPVSTALGDVVIRVQRGHRIADALDDLPERLGAPVRPLIRALVASERYGIELGPTLERISAEARDDRRRRAQTTARRVPVRMLLPLVLGVLPAFVLLTLVPTLVSTFDTLDLGTGS